MSDHIIRAKNGDADYFKLTPVEKWKHADVLSAAIENYHVHCAKVIYRRCPELLHRRGDDERRFTALHHAAHREDTPSMIKFLISVGDRKLFRTGDAWQNNALELAIEHNKFYAFQLMAEADPDLLSHVDDGGLTPLFKIQNCRGSEYDKEKFRKFILQKQPNASKVLAGVQKWTALHDAASKGDLGAIQDIIRYCPDSVQVVDNQGNDFIDTAVRFGHSKVVKKVLQRKEIWDSILKGNNTQGIKKLQTFLYEVNTMSQREQELCIPPEHVVLYRELVDKFGEIVDPSIFIGKDPTPMYEALRCFLNDVSELVDVQPGQEEKISNWEKMAAQYSAMGLQVSWFQKLVARYSDWLARDTGGCLKDEIATKKAILAIKEEEFELKLRPLWEELQQLKAELKDLESDPFSVIWQIIRK